MSTTELEPQLAALEEKQTRMFPIQPQRGAPPHPLWIHWEVAELAYSNYAARFGRSQSLEELARRGGFCPYEMDDQLPGWREIEAARGDLERENAELKSQLATDKELLNYAEGIIRERESQILRLTEEARALREEKNTAYCTIGHLKRAQQELQREARELRALILKCHEIYPLADEEHDFDIYRPTHYQSKALEDVLALARSERTAEARHD